MSTGVCGKRMGFEEIFGSSPSSAKRSRCSNFGSPTRSPDFLPGSEDNVLALLQMFPALDPELVKTVLRNHNNKIDDAVESLRESSFDAGERNASQSSESATIGNCDALLPSGAATCIQMSEQEVEGVKPTGGCENMVNGSAWVELFVQEMMNVADLDDAKGRAARILEGFERCVTACSRASEEQEHAALKEHLHCLLNDNQILKRAVAIQHERNLEQEGKTREVENLKLVLNQYQEQIQNLELSNYTLRLHLQRAQQSNSIPGQFHPDIY